MKMCFNKEKEGKRKMRKEIRIRAVGSLDVFSPDAADLLSTAALNE